MNDEAYIELMVLFFLESLYNIFFGQPTCSWTSQSRITAAKLLESYPIGRYNSFDRQCDLI